MNIKQAYSLIAEADAVGHVLQIESVHGIGKSSICDTYAQENQLHFEPLFLSLMDTGDLIGIPKIDNIGGQATTTWAAPTWYTRIVDAAWPVEMKLDDVIFDDTAFGTYVTSKASSPIARDELNNYFCEFFNKRPNQLHILRQDKVRYKHAQRSVLFLDELNRAPMDVLNASLQLILEKRLNDHILPTVNGKDTLVISATNPSNGKYTVVEFDPALLDRFVLCKLEPDATAWLEYARKQNSNPVVREYIAENPQRIHFEDKNGGKGASSRTWTRLSKYLDHIDNTPTENTMNYIVGTLGEGLAAEFYLFLEGYARSMTPEQWVKEVAKASKRQKDIVKLGAKLMPTVESLEAIKRNELASNLEKEFIDAEDATPFMAYLHAMPTENLASYLTSLKQNNKESYDKVALLDKDASGKKLFHKLLAKQPQKTE